MISFIKIITIIFNIIGIAIVIDIIIVISIKLLIFVHFISEVKVLSI